ncbi:helix-turn-helix domain-containing protein [Paenibacillus jiagnxiensis]|uniref:helix-turn-helix domain-containing protein n=1 Tax=Paenibacillus jiagnxiensis TaxID=3228926 RepID=UPI0033A5EEB1
MYDFKNGAMMVNNNYIKRMLLSYLPILLITVSVFIFIFISIMNQLYVRNTIQANRLTAEYVANMVDSSLKSISLDAQKMIEPGGTISYYLDGPSDQALEYDVSNLLKGLMIQHGMIDSVYLYRVKDNKVLDQSAIRTLEEFPDRNYILDSQQQAYPGVWSSPRLKEVEARGAAKTTRVTSLGFKIPRDTGSLGFLIINVRISSLQAFIDQMIDRNITTAQLLDPKSEFFSDENNIVSSNSRLSADIISDYTGWTYRISIKAGQLFTLLFHGSTAWLWIGLSAIIFAICSTFYVTRRSYKPIEAIMDRIERFSASVRAADRMENEFSFIDQAIERLITNNMAYQEQQQENQVIRRQQFLQLLLKGDYEGGWSAWEQERHYYELEAGFFIVALLELDRYVPFSLKYSLKDQSLFKFIVSSIEVEIAEQNSQRMVAEWIAKNRLVLLLLANERGALEYQMLQVSEKIRVWVQNHLDFTVTIGIGSAAEDEYSIARSFQDAEAAVSRKVSFGTNQIIDVVEVKGKAESEWLAYLDIIRIVIRLFRLSKPDWSAELKRLFDEMAAQRLRREDVDRLLNYLIFQLEYELEGSLPDAVEPWLEKVKPKLTAAMDQFDTLGQLESDFMETLGQFSLQLEELLSSLRHHSLIQEIREYITTHFSDPDLSLTLLSDRFQIGPKYLSQLFKECVGENFSDFLIGLRIENAKKLLRETDETVQDISACVGYLNTTSFIRVFKKVVGMSPRQYRESRP